MSSVTAPSLLDAFSIGDDDDMDEEDPYTVGQRRENGKKYQTVEMRVDGMMCQRNCGSTVQAALEREFGSSVREARATFATSYARVTVDWYLLGESEEKVKERAVDAIECVGFDARLLRPGETEHSPSDRLTINLRVEGMMCQKNCGSTVQRALQNFVDKDLIVGQARATHATSFGTVTVDLHKCREQYPDMDPVKLQQEAMDAVECVGFDARLLRADEREEDHAPPRLRGAATSDEASEASGNSRELLLSPESATSAGTSVASFQVGGMSCAVCSGRVERALLSVDGVQSAVVTLATNQARVEFSAVAEDPASAVPKSVQECVHAVQRGGYECEVIRVHVAGQGGADDEEAGVDDRGDALARSADRLERAQRSELRSWRRLLLISTLFTLPLVILHYSRMDPHHHHPDKMLDDDTDEVKPPTVEDWLMFVLATPVQFGIGFRFYRAAFHSFWADYTVGMDFLVVMGTTAAYAFSIIVFALQLIVVYGPDEGSVHDNAMSLLKNGGSGHTHLHPTFETGAMLLTFVTLGKFLEAYARGKTASALQNLMELQPVVATRALLDSSHFQAKASKDTDLLSLDQHWQKKEKKKRSSEEERQLVDDLNIHGLSTEDVNIADVRVGDYLLVLPGSRVPTDGVVAAVDGGGKNTSKVSRTLYIDESALSGEPLPVAKALGDEVYGSTVNQLSPFLLRVTGTGGSTVLARIVRLIEEAQGNRAPIQAQADAVASVFAPAVTVLSVITFIGWAVFDRAGSATTEERLFVGLMSAISVIVVACPCALGLATPTAVMVGTGVGASNGLLIKGGAVLEEAHSVDTVIFDKTGTLTTGRTVMGSQVDLVVNSDSSPNPDEPLLRDLPANVEGADLTLWLAACAELGSEHPLSHAIVNAARGRWGGDVCRPGTVVRDFSVVPGSGVECVVSRPQGSWGSWTVRVGNRAWAKGPVGPESDHFSVDDATGDEEISMLRRKGELGVYVSVIPADSSGLHRRRRVVGVLGILDSVEPEAASTVAALQRMGVEVWMCTGDHEQTALAVARQVGIDEENVCAGVKPEGKADLVTRLQRESREGGRRTKWTKSGQKRRRRRGGRVAVVGDGINDSVALARADVGIAVGAGTEVAVEAAGIVLVRSSLHDVVVALHLSRFVFRRIRINFVWAMGYNMFALPFAAGALYPFTEWRLPPAFAGLMMAFSSVSVVTSSLLLRTYVKPHINEQGVLERPSNCRCCSCGSGISLQRRRSAKYYNRASMGDHEDMGGHVEMKLT